jgi:hypothetical protein
MTYVILSVLLIAGLVLSLMGGGWVVAGFALWFVAYGITLHQHICKKV